jgi:predicted RecB family endonuclease
MSKTRAGMLYTAGLKAGIPDILIFYDGRTFAIELKTGKGKLSAVQKTTQDCLAAAGVFVCVCRSVDEVESVLRELELPLRGTVRAA